jgi:hypothetical protein
MLYLLVCGVEKLLVWIPWTLLGLRLLGQATELYLQILLITLPTFKDSRRSIYESSYTHLLLGVACFQQIPFSGGAS